MNPQELGLLINALRNKDHGFFLVEVDGVGTLNDLLLKLKIAAGQAGKKTAALDFSALKKGETVADFINSHLDELKGVQAVFLSNFSSPLATSDELSQIFRLLNQTREFLERLQKNWIFLLTPDELKAFQAHARDLFSWTPQRFVLHGSIESPRDFSQSLRMEEKTRFLGDKDRDYLQSLISLYEEQLRDAPDDEAYRIRNIVIPLADLYEENDQHDKELPLRREIVAFSRKSGEREELAEGLNNLGITYTNLLAGDRGSNLQQAIAALHEALTVYTKESYPVQYAMLQNNLGAAYSNLLAGNRDKNLRQAITAYQEALNIFTKEAFPVDYAMTQNNLGTAYADLPTGDRGKNLRLAIAAYQEALSICTKEALPVDYARTQNNLGNAFAQLPAGNRSKNLQQAIAAYQEALSIRTKEAFPFDYATTQYNLGTAYTQLPAGDRSRNLQRAIAAFQEALSIQTKKVFPHGYALTQYNLGNAYVELPTGDRSKNLRQAIEALRKARSVFTYKNYPEQNKDVIEKLMQTEQSLQKIETASQ